MSVFGRTLRPDYPEALNNLGIALQGKGRLDEAAACYRRTLLLRPDMPEAHNNLGTALQEQGRPDEAAACYGRAIALRPDYAGAHNNLGNALRELGRLEQAEHHGRTAITLRPDFGEAHNGLGTTLQTRGRPEEALACFHRAIGLNPNHAEACSNLGTALKAGGRLDEAMEAYRRAIELRPDHAETHNNLGTGLMAQGRLDEAVAACRRAIELRPDYPDAHSNLAMTLLAQGDMAAGWAEYEWRWKTPSMIKVRRDFAQPQWGGEEAQGRTLLIHAEQGFGDTLQFCRYAALAAAQGSRVVLEVPGPLVRLMGGLEGVDRVVAFGEALPAFDLHCPMLSLPLALGTTLATIPDAVPYLRADPVQVAAWRTRLAAIEAIRVGLVWAGGARPDQPAAAAVDRRRSMPPERLAPLLDVQGVRFFSLQKDGPAAPADFGLTDYMDEMGDFADTAALIANLDLVIAVDTAVAHLAAALGRPVWLLDRFDACWRWLRGRRDSPWYPALRLFRQPRQGDWESVVEEVKTELRDFRGYSGTVSASYS